ncbi:KIF-binding protein isoform X2 [Carcharodon carcharias]|uniref:KIF-binding protein isoform X2 n=1 Tax=Carcharodon carcharias TaxID=13397 RepID=UPI001B7DB786|nr:KIF-binding protein isoform X2 [Carcharodon carcharias]
MAGQAVDRELELKYSRALNLSEVESKQDPESEPYRSKYAARELLKELKAVLGQRAQAGELEDERAQDCEWLQKAAVLELQLGLNHTETEELSAGEEHLAKCVQILETCKLSPEAVSVFMQAVIGTPPFDTHEHFLAEEERLTEQERQKRFEKVYTHTLYYLAQVYKHLDMNEKAAWYCHTTLQRQLQFTNYNPVEWAINAATLSQYYITKQSYMEGRLCLAASSVIFNQVGGPSSESPTEESEEERDRRDQLQQKKAEIARCWIKYCLNLLQDSRKLLEDDVGELDWDRQEELKIQLRKEEEEKEQGRKSAVLFGSSETFDLIQSVEEKVSCTYPADFAKAREVFLVGQNYVQEAKEFFQLDDHVTDHIEVVQDHSALFKALAFFEEDQERRCKMHKRRIDMLEMVYKELNPQYYLLVCRQLQFEIADTYYEMMELKVSIANRLDELDSHNIKKINHLAQSAITYYNLFLDSLKNSEKKFPEMLEADVLRPALVCKFRIGWLYGKMITSDPKIQLGNLQQSVDCYRFVVDYCERQPQAARVMEPELELCAEMTTLLPARMEKLRAKLVAFS